MRPALGLLVLAVFFGQRSRGQEVTIATGVSDVGNVNKTEVDDMQTAASTNIVHWMSTLDSEKREPASPESAVVAGEHPPTPANTTEVGETPSPTSASSVAEGEHPPTPAITTESAVVDDHHGHTAEEVADMNIDPYRNHTDEDTGGSGGDVDEGVSKDTDTVADSHVVISNKTHEEEAQNREEKKDTSESVLKPADAAILANSGTAEVPAQDAHQSDHERVNAAVDGGATEVAAILGGVLITIAVVGYLVLLAWRRLLERRYGNREMLVNEEDDDLRHFEL